MKKLERESLITSIEATAAQLSPELVTSVLRRFGARSIYQLRDSDLSDAFSDLYAIAEDLKD